MDSSLDHWWALWKDQQLGPEWDHQLVLEWDWMWEPEWVDRLVLDSDWMWAMVLGIDEKFIFLEKKRVYANLFFSQNWGYPLITKFLGSGRRGVGFGVASRLGIFKPSSYNSISL